MKSRITSKTPTFFKVIRNIGLTLAAVSGAILTAPVALPAVAVTIASYLALAGTVAGVVAQTAKDNE